MRKSRPYVFFFILILLFSLAVQVRAQGSSILVVSDAASLSFPDTLSFNAEFTASDNITSVTLEYGVDQLTCGTVQAKAFPSITASPDVKATWTWDMRQSGSLPPGSTVWWFWQVNDAGGATFTSPQKTTLWLDNTHSWQVITGGNINLHYYNGTSDFGQQLHDAAVTALTRLTKDVGVGTDTPVDIYIYGNYTDLQDSILFAPTWVGGQAFPESNIVIIGISPDLLDWGKSTEAHELTHVLVGHLTFSCLGFVPTWLNEGLAVYGEGGPQAAAQSLFDQAKTNNQLPSIRSLTGAFSAESDRANLSYAEAYSVVDYLIVTYGRDKMTSLLLDLKNGMTTDAALTSVYGYNTDGLDNAWRKSINVPSLAGNANPTPVPTPTEVPTFIPIGSAPLAQAVTQSPATPQAAANTPMTPAPTPADVTPAATQAPSVLPAGLSLNSILIAALACLVVVILLAVLIIFLITRRRKGSQQ